MSARSLFFGAVLVLVACDKVDRCLDAGGAWNAEQNSCQFCSLSDQPAHCLAEGFDSLYQHNNDRFWALFDAAWNEASACSSPESISSVLSLASSIRGNAEVAEAFAEHAEKLLVSNPSCVLDAAETLSDAQLDDFVRLYLVSPTFVSPDRMTEVLNKHAASRTYPRFNARLSQYKPAG